MMDLAFVTEARFTRDRSGNIFCEASYDRKLWERYLEAFDHIYVICRVNYDADFIGDVGFLSNISGVTFVEVPYYVGPLGYLSQFFRLNRFFKEQVAALSRCKFILRVPGLLGTMAAKHLIGAGKAYALEVVGDPDAVFSSGTIKHPLVQLFRIKAVSDLKWTISNSSAVLYVTQDTLQKKYPAPKTVYQTFASDVRLADDLIESHHKLWADKGEISILSIGSLAQMYKSPDILLRALALIKEQLPRKNINLVWLGDGVFKAEMIRLAADLGLANEVSFLGNVSSEEVFRWLQRADIFVLVSRTEGLPRAVIEAMSKGLPIVGSRVGGIPELLDDAALVDREDIDQLSDKIVQFVQQEAFYNEQSRRNLELAGQYRESILSMKRLNFYDYINANL